jgi:type IV secretory pathway VirB10-like protein
MRFGTNAGQQTDEEARMSEIAEYERRISFALERIGRGVEVLAQKRVAPAEPEAEPEHLQEAAFEQMAAPETAPPEVAPPESEVLAAPQVPDAAPSSDLAQMQAALDAEREANAQLSERVRAIREKQDTTLNAMERKYGAAVRAQEAAFKEVAALKAANTALIASNRKLMDEGVAFSEEALMAELTALRAARASEFNELGDILDGLAPILAQAEEESQDA